MASSCANYGRMLTDWFPVLVLRVNSTLVVRVQRSWGKPQNSTTELNEFCSILVSDMRPLVVQNYATLKRTDRHQNM